MASTYQELYSDFLEQLALYTEKANVTDKQFMRYITIAAQEFQRLTKVVNSEKQLFRDNNFDLGDDILEIIELQDETGNKLLSMEYAQFRNEWERTGNPNSTPPTSIYDYYNSINRAETVFRYDIGRNPPDPGDDQYGIHTRIWTVLNNNVLLYPDQQDEILELHYHPDIHPFSRTSPQWSDWFPYDTNFATLFETRTLGPELAKWEQALVQRAIARYTFILVDKDKSYQMRKDFDYMVQQANDKQILYKTGSSPYHISPFS